MTLQNTTYKCSVTSCQHRRPKGVYFCEACHGRLSRAHREKAQHCLETAREARRWLEGKPLFEETV